MEFLVYIYMVVSEGMLDHSNCMILTPKYSLLSFAISTITGVSWGVNPPFLDIEPCMDYM
jgi:hypothetical protein